MVVYCYKFSNTLFFGWDLEHFEQLSCTEFHAKVKESNLPNYLPIDRGRIGGLISSLRVLILCEIQIASFKSWTRVANSTHDDKSYNSIQFSNLPFFSLPLPQLLRCQLITISWHIDNLRLKYNCSVKKWSKWLMGEYKYYISR